MGVIVDIEKDFGSFCLETSFQAEQGVHGILGASGCGKSMTLRCIAGIVKPDRGHIEVDGTVFFDSASGIDLPPRSRKVGLLFQNYALFPNMTVRQNLMCAMRGQKKEEAEGKLREAVEKFHLEGLEGHRPAQLSGGQQQRTALARILLTNPSILMLDEPLSALDSYLRWQTELELLEVLDTFEGATLLVTHSRDEIRRLCDTVTVMERGKGIETMAADALFVRPETMSACLLSGCKNFSRIKRLGAHKILAVDWNTELATEALVTAEVSYVGIRAHYLTWTEEPGENRVPCSLEREVDSLFSTILMFETTGENRSYSRLRAEFPKGLWKNGTRGKKGYLYMKPQDLMLLR